MKSNMLVPILFDDWGVGEKFISDIYGLIEDSLEFNCDIDRIISCKNFSFSKGIIKVMWSIRDGEDNGGFITTRFDYRGLVSVSLYFQYEDGNEYDETLYQR